MATAVHILVFLAWFVYLADTDMYKASYQCSLDNIILQTSTRDRLACSGLCTKTDGCASFSFTKVDRHCTLARNITVDLASSGVYMSLESVSASLPLHCLKVLLHGEL